MKFKFVDKQGQDISQGPKYWRTRSGKFEATDTPLVDKHGNYNATSKKDLIETVATIVAMLQSGDLQHESEPDVNEKAALNKLVEAALGDPSERGGAFERLGQVFVDVVSETMGRQAFTDKIMAQLDIPERGIPKVEIDQFDVVTWHMTSAGAVKEVVSKPRFHFPEGFWLNCMLVIEEQDLHFAGEQFLERKYNTALQSLMVREDNVTKFLLDQAAPIANDVISFSAFTPVVFALLREQVWQHGLTATTALVSVDLQNDILADTDWHNIYSPVEKHILLTEGKLGSLAGIEVFTDGYRMDTLRVLDSGEVYMLAAPQTLGVKGVMRPLYSDPINLHVFGRPARGWFLGQYEVIDVTNHRAVARGTKL